MIRSAQPKFLALLFFACILSAMLPSQLSAQCKPTIKIDNKLNVVDPNDKFGLPLPFWLKEGQTLAIGSSVNSLSIIEFTVNGTALEFSQVLNFTSSSPQTVPGGKVWKLESVSKENNSSTYQSATFGAGTFTWKVPACAEQICIEVWGGGGGGGGGRSASPYSAGGGGGGGGFGSQCFAVVPGTNYSVTVGDGGAGGTPNNTGATGGSSSVGSLITTTGGNGGNSSASGGTGGAGGTSTATSNAQGATGATGDVYSSCASTYSGSGGAAGNGAAGGTSVVGVVGAAGSAPGGGGSGGGCQYTGGKGGAGKVIISW